MVKHLKLTVVNDNEPGEGLINDWGWSTLLETEDWRVLFDADTDPAVIKHNFRVLGIDPGSIDFAVLSHWHSDHYGGFSYLGEVRPGLKVYVPPGPTSILRDWGLTPEVIREGTQPARDLVTTGPIGYLIREQAIGVEVDGLGWVVVVGCSHPGADSLARKVAELTGGKIHMVIGGYHEPPRRVLDNLSEIAEVICPAHCSGDTAKEYVRRKYPNKYCSVRTGSVLEFP